MRASRARKKHRDLREFLYHSLMQPLPIDIDREAKTPLSEQIYAAIRAAIVERRLAAGARLPSWTDLSAQLGVARGTTRAAYERLVDEQLAEADGARGTRVAERPPLDPRQAEAPAAPPQSWPFQDYERAPLLFRPCLPAHDAFPHAQWSRLSAQAARAAAAAPLAYPDPRGEMELRRTICAYLAVARGLHCAPEQVIVTTGYFGALGLALRALPISGREAWLEEPAFPVTREALRFAGLKIVPVRVDAQGLDVAEAVRRAPRATLAAVTPSQQAPLGMAMSLPRRLALLRWASETGAHVIEDDYLGELQLDGRAAPALASLDRDGRVVYAGTFSKTMSPALRLGFLVAPPALAARFAQIAACLAPAPAPATQRAVAAFIAEGHFLRHLRRMKRLYAARRHALTIALREAAGEDAKISACALSLKLDLPEDADDLAIAARAVVAGLAPAPLSPWYAEEPRPRGLLLGVANIREARLAEDCRRLLALARDG